jgi:hypothetical protein
LTEGRGRKNHNDFFRKEAKWIVCFTLAPIIIGLLIALFLRFTW